MRMTCNVTIAGLTLCALWAIGWGWYYFNQMKEWKRRATWAEHQLKKRDEQGAP
jgi:hypothetical protein